MPLPLLHSFSLQISRKLIAPAPFHSITFHFIPFFLGYQSDFIHFSFRIRNSFTQLPSAFLSLICLFPHSGCSNNSIHSISKVNLARSGLIINSGLIQSKLNLINDVINSISVLLIESQELID